MFKTPPEHALAKLKIFEKDIIKEAADNRADIEADLEKYRQSEMKKIEDMTLEDTFFSLQSEVSDLAVSHAKAISRYGMEYKKQLFEKRQELFEKIFTAVCEKLSAFTASDEYKNYLERKINEFKASNPCETVVIFIRNTDEKYIDFLKKTYELPCEINIDSNIKLGGLIFKDKTKPYAVDMSIDTALDGQKDWFYQNCDLSVGE